MNNDNEKILVVDDSVETVEVLKRNLQEEGYVVFSAYNVIDAIKVLESSPIDLVMTDLKMPKVSGLDLIRHVRENYKDTEVMMITGYATINGAVEAIKTGAEEYLTKPFTDEELLNSVKRILNKLHDRRMVQQDPLSTTFMNYGLIGYSPSMQKVFQSIEKVSLSIANILITGESGTGKE
ncbi:MAG: sigma-54-dependent Fis family transcriptional regulator, partial [Calditrichia bacterium]|nr:sigma-54-dependent Fis family transcriptional regulator [Calditrichia bacterium]